MTASPPCAHIPLLCRCQHNAEIARVDANLKYVRKTVDQVLDLAKDLEADLEDERESLRKRTELLNEVLADRTRIQDKLRRYQDALAEIALLPHGRSDEARGLAQAAIAKSVEE